MKIIQQDSRNCLQIVDLTNVYNPSQGHSLNRYLWEVLTYESLPVFFKGSFCFQILH